MAKWFTEDPDTVWEGLDATMRRKVTRWIARAEAIIGQKFPGIDDRITAGALDAQVVSGVVEEMVERAIAHEESGGVESEQMPEFSVTFRQAQGMGQGSVLFLTTDEYALLAPPRAGTRISSIRMRRAYEVTDPDPAA